MVETVRETLRNRIARRAEIQAEISAARAGHERALDAVSDAQNAVNAARAALDDAKAQHAAAMAGAFAKGAADVALDSRAVRKAREALAEAEDRRDAATEAAAKLESDLRQAEQRMSYASLNDVIGQVVRRPVAAMYHEAVETQRRLVRMKAALEFLNGRGLLFSDDASDPRRFLDHNTILPRGGAIMGEFHAALDTSAWRQFLATLETNPDAEAPEI